MSVKIYFSSRNHAPVLIRSIKTGLEQGKTVEVYTDSSTAFSKAGEAILDANLEATISKENDLPKYILEPEQHGKV